MTFLAGQVLTADQLNTRVGTTGPITADSADYTTTETELMSVSASLVAGRLYKVVAFSFIGTSVAADDDLQRIREDDTAGNALNQGGTNDMASGTPGNKTIVEGFYTPGSDENKTFVFTGQRTAGTGDHRLEANSGRPAWMYVDYVPEAP